jgi:hypothetical protein
MYEKAKKPTYLYLSYVYKQITLQILFYWDARPEHW